MLQSVDVGEQALDSYAQFVPEAAIQELRQLGRELKGARVLEINATRYGGGVSELLRSVVPIMRDLGVVADWKLIHADQQFFTLTKSLHNALQGAPFDLTVEAKELYRHYSQINAERLEEKYDFVVVHDPQPAGLLHFHGRNHAKWVWRCHIDTSQPCPEAWMFLKPYIDEYDAAIFTLPQFVPEDLAVPSIAIIPPAIDPLSPKNLPLDPELCRRILDWIGVDTRRPLITQVSRFDPWKDPIGVIDMYRLVRERFPDAQLALVASMALDDPEAWSIYNQIVEYAQNDPDVRLFTNLTGVSDMEVNAFQRVSRVVVQKSIREGFGLVVSESLWKGTPVVAGKAGGIPLQLEDGIGGFLIEEVEACAFRAHQHIGDAKIDHMEECLSSIERCAERVIYLLEHPEEAREIGLRGRERVRERFLITRLVADELRLLASLSK